MEKQTRYQPEFFLEECWRSWKSGMDIALRDGIHGPCGGQLSNVAVTLALDSTKDPEKRAT